APAASLLAAVDSLRGEHALKRKLGALTRDAYVGLAAVEEAEHRLLARDHDRADESHAAPFLRQVGRRAAHAIARKRVRALRHARPVALDEVARHRPRLRRSARREIGCFPTALSSSRALRAAHPARLGCW